MKRNKKIKELITEDQKERKKKIKDDIIKKKGNPIIINKKVWMAKT